MRRSTKLLPRCFNIIYKAIHTSHLDIASPIFSLLQRFNVLLYTKSSNVELVDEARLELFCCDNKTICIENIPPTADALLQHMMQGEQPIRLVSGLQVKMHNQEGLHQNSVADLRWMQQEMGACLDYTANTQRRGCVRFVDTRFVDSRFVDFLCTSIAYSQPQTVLGGSGGGAPQF